MHPLPDSSEYPHRWISLALALVALLIGLALYGDTLDYGFFNDDPVYVRIIQNVTLTDLFLSRTANPFYRPVNFVPLELLEMTAGRVTAPPLHMLGLLLHVLNGWLLAVFTRRIFPSRRLIPWLAMALYLAYPFSYQAVPYVAAMGHLQAATGMLIALLGLDRWLESRRWPDLALMLIGVFVANFAHENGIISGALLALWMFFRQYNCSIARLRAEWRTAAVLIPAFAINLLYLIVWRSLSNNPAPPAHIVESFPRNLAYFAQGLAYPVTQFGQALSLAAGWDRFVAAGLLALIGVGVLLSGLWLLRDRRAWFVPAWFALVILIPALFLDWPYTLTAPHLLMMPSPAIALLWAAALAGWWQDRFPLAQAAVMLVAVIALVGGAAFVRARLDLQHRMEALYADVYAEIERGGDGVQFFNLPGWITPQARVFALDESGVVYKPRYLPFRELVWANTGLDYEQKPILWHDNIPLYDAFWMEYVDEAQPGLEERLAAVRSAESFFRVKALPGQFALEQASPAPDISFDGALDFSNAVLVIPRAAFVTERNMVNVEITLQTVNGQVQEKLFVHLLCGDKIIAQADGALMGEIYPYDYWQAGETWREVRVIEVPRETPVDCLAVRLGMFHPVTGVRPTLPDGAEWVVIPVEHP